MTNVIGENVEAFLHGQQLLAERRRFCDGVDSFLDRCFSLRGSDGMNRHHHTIINPEKFPAIWGWVGYLVHWSLSPISTAITVYCPLLFLLRVIWIDSKSA